MTKNLEPDIKLFGALRRASSRWPLYFFASKKMIKVPSRDVETLDIGLHNVEGHDFVTMFYNPDFVDSIERDDLLPYIYHTCSHLMSQHLIRRKHREIPLWDLACDVMVDYNNSIVNDSPAEYPDFFSRSRIQEIPCLKNINFEETTTEQIYDILKEDFEPPESSQQKLPAGGGPGPSEGNENEEKEDTDDSADNGNGKDDDSGDEQGEESEKAPPENPNKQKEGPDSHVFWHNQESTRVSPSLNTQQETAINQFLEETIREFGAQEPGDVPGEVKRFLEHILKPKTQWKRYIKAFAQRSVTTKKEKTWKRPSRRYFNGEYSIAPGKKFIRKPRILIVVDNSMSIGNAEFAEFIAHMSDIAFLCEKLDVIGVDVVVNLVHKDLKVTKKGQLPKLVDFKSGGGTKFQPAFDFAKESDYTGIIYFTDGCNADLKRLDNYGIPVLFALCRGEFTKPVPGFPNIYIESEKKQIWGA